MLSKMVIRKKNGHACWYSFGVHFSGNSCKDFHQSCQKKAFHSREHFQKCSSLSDCFCNEYKLCIYWIIQWKRIPVSRIFSPTKSTTQRSVNCRVWCCWQLSRLCYDNENNELWRWYPFISNFKDHYKLVFDFTLMQDATENCQYPDLVGNPLRVELNFTLPLQHVTEPIASGERMPLVAVDIFGVVGKISKLDDVLPQQIFIRIPHWSVVRVVVFPLTRFQLSTMTLLPL